MFTGLFRVFVVALVEEMESTRNRIGQVKRIDDFSVENNFTFDCTFNLTFFVVVRCYHDAEPLSCMI